MKRLIFIHAFILFSLFSSICVAQEEENEESEAVEMEESEGRHSLALVLAHARIGQGRDAEGKKQFTTVPSFALDYNYWISEKFAIGLHTDFLNENFFIETEDEGEIIERERPIAPVVTGVYKPGEHWSFSLGFGGEFAEGEDYFVTRLGVEYGVEIRNGWEVLGSLTHDFRANAYNVTSLGIGIEKRFGE
ncbi:hypothetical protein PBT90_20175 [Algoriphagus halophytocola]|uniref:Outer membrane protein beta-barrel domain-containing protein n=1 Tax=Algoriphagus halophytocola TaxID=2991499 RepID=A0ABY6MHD8_9BACT|nr:MULTISPECIES: hypothetical protein [unclassified Algoriphagus]UZD21832.1 hypothetical protein OM944_14290 [Algoriphagus sp. TR-M5]WBL43046.1 hypothetical protein PBT90_20175 [Algoriphagus sp. TR-M9]